MTNPAETYTKMICALAVATEAHKALFADIIEPADHTTDIGDHLAQHMGALLYATAQKGELLQNGGLQFLTSGLPPEFRDPAIQQRLAQEAHQEMQPKIDGFRKVLGGAAGDRKDEGGEKTWVSRTAPAAAKGPLSQIKSYVAHIF